MSSPCDVTTQQRETSTHRNASDLGPYSPNILKNSLSFSPRFVTFNVIQFLIGYGLANQKLCYIQMLLNIEKNLKNKTKNILNPFPNQPWFLCVCRKGLLKTLWVKEKLLVSSNFSFSHTAFSCHFEIFLLLSSNMKLSSANSFSLEGSKVYCLGKG